MLLSNKTSDIATLISYRRVRKLVEIVIGHTFGWHSTQTRTSCTPRRFPTSLPPHLQNSQPKHILKPKEIMAQSPPYSPSPSPGIPSSHELSDSSSSDDFPLNGELFEHASASRGGSPLIFEQIIGGEGDGEGEDTISCQWEECGRVFNHLPTLIEHIHNGMGVRVFPHVLCPHAILFRPHRRA